jgi:molecular chaperone DnaJ
MAKNYYLILEITGDASQEQIKSAYRQKARELHPDYYGEDREPFQNIQEAYAVLGDPARRRAYDDALDQERRTRSMPRGPSRYRRRHPKVEPLIPEQQPEEIESISLHDSFLHYAPSFEELFDRLWSNFSGHPHPKAEHQENLTVEIPLSWEQARRGGQARLTLPVQMACSGCRGRGWVGPFDCLQCRGRGVLTGEYPIEISYPPGIDNSYIRQVSLDHLGIRNFYLTVYFRVRNEP